MAYQFEETIKNAMETGVLAGAGVLAATKDQGLVYSKSFGRRSLEKGPESEPLDIDDMMSLASASKLVTSIAALQVVERGFVGVDDDLGGILPELGALKVLRKVEDAEGKIKLEERKGEITLRRLLSHSSGLTYAFISPLVQGYNVSRGLPPFQPFETVTKSFSDPLVAQPGMTWEYGSGIEWAGYLVSRLTGQSLEEYTQGNIALPLGIHDLTYFPHRRNPEQTLKERKLVSMTRRDPDGNGTVIPDTTPHFLSHAKEEMGGVGIYTSMASYIKILHSLLVNDGKLLKPETVDTFFFQPQLSPASRAVLQSKFSHIQPGQERGTPPYVGTFVQVKHDHSLAGLLSLEDVYSGDLKWRRNGYLCWSGMPNIFWFIDRQAGLCGVFGTQLLPSADEQVRKVIDAFEKAMYKDFAL